VTGTIGPFAEPSKQRQHVLEAPAAPPHPEGGMFARKVEWAVAGSLASWAAIRLLGADRLTWAQAWIVPLLAFTPQAGAAACAAPLVLRSRGASATAALAGVALASATAPRAVPRRQPAATGPVLRMLTANLLRGRATAGPLADLVRSSGADVLFVQELTWDMAARLERAGINDLLPSQVTQPTAAGSRGSGIYASRPLRDGRCGDLESAVGCQARLDLAEGRAVRLACVHVPPPLPSRSPAATARWRAGLAALPPPGDPPVILAGDFNATADHAQFRRVLRLGHQDAARQTGHGLVPTWGPEPSGRPSLLTIDHILLDPRCGVSATSAHELPGTDHRALYAEIHLPG
jgi:endonuclease/exonuclease/phosphatase family metal-dependent hydrolase